MVIPGSQYSNFIFNIFLILRQERVQIKIAVFVERNLQIIFHWSIVLVMFCSYDDEAERITQYERIALEDLEKIEIGK